MDYISRADLRKEAEKISRALQMEPTKETNKVGNLAESLAKLKEGLLAIVEMISATEQTVASFKGKPRKIINPYEMSDDELLEWFIKSYGRKKRKKKD